VSSNQYTIVATMPPNTTKEQFQKMLQNMVAERFHVVFHRETRNFPGYALVVDKGGPKLKELTSTRVPSPETPLNSRATLGAGTDGFPNFPGPCTIALNGRSGEERIKYQERTMAEVASNLGLLIVRSQGKSGLDGFLQPRVADKTGLTGKYTFILEYYSEGAAAQMANFPGGADSNAANGAPPTPSDPGAVNIFVAIQKQLGLRLDKTVDVPLDMIVVDSVDKVPTAD
jgi:uncharacterized protein (TIGR03435 family)